MLRGPARSGGDEEEPLLGGVAAGRTQRGVELGRWELVSYSARAPGQRALCTKLSLSARLQGERQSLPRGTISSF